MKFLHPDDDMKDSQGGEAAADHVADMDAFTGNDGPGAPPSSSDSSNPPLDAQTTIRSPSVTLDQCAFGERASRANKESVCKLANKVASQYAKCGDWAETCAVVNKASRSLVVKADDHFIRFPNRTRDQIGKVALRYIRPPAPRASGADEHTWQLDAPSPRRPGVLGEIVDMLGKEVLRLQPCTAEAAGSRAAESTNGDIGRKMMTPLRVHYAPGRFMIGPSADEPHLTVPIVAKRTGAPQTVTAAGSKRARTTSAVEMCDAIVQELAETDVETTPSKCEA